MTISYPLSLPSTGVTKVTFNNSHAVSIVESPYTYISQTQVHPGQRWSASIEMPTLSRSDAEQWQCFLLQLNGRAGTFYLTDPLHPSPIGNWSGTPMIDGAGQSGQTLNIKGLAVGATIAPGDMFQIGTRLYKHIGLSTVVADGSGKATIDIWPRLRTPSPGNNDPIITESPAGIFRLSQNESELFSTVALEYYQITLDAIEAL